MDIKKLIIHAGSFHSDDVMCAALCQIAFPDIEIERVTVVPAGALEDPEVIVADIGHGRYDHHQPDARRRFDGYKYAACGLVFEAIWDRIFPDEESASRFEKDFIIPIERSDNGVVHNPLSIAIGSMNPAWGTDELENEQFERALLTVRYMVEREVAVARAEAKAKEMVMDALEKAEHGIVTLPEHAPWEHWLTDTDATFVIFPSKRGGYCLQGVPVEEGSFTVKIRQPESWLRLPPDGCTFTHATGFLSVFDTPEQAFNAAVKVVTGIR